MRARSASANLTVLASCSSSAATGSARVVRWLYSYHRTHLRKLGIPASAAHHRLQSTADLPEFVQAYGLLSKDDPDHMQLR